MQIKRETIKKIPGRLIRKLIDSWSLLRSYSIFIILLFLYIFRGLIKRLQAIKILGMIVNRLGANRICKFCDLVMSKVDLKTQGEVSRVYMIELALKNLKSKKTRAAITIGGVAVGVAAIVFLVSLGYGLEKMVITRVARLDELKMFDVGLGEVSSLKMNEELIKKIEGADGVLESIPVVSMVSKVKYKNSVLDVMAFGVDQRYLKAVGAKMLAGEQFSDKNKNTSEVSGGGNVAGVDWNLSQVNFGDRVGKGINKYQINAKDKVAIYDKCSTDGQLLGFSLRVEGGLVGEEVWGEAYYDESVNLNYVTDKVSGKEMAKWVRLKTPLWKVDDQGLAVPILTDAGYQRWEIGCVKSIGLMMETEVEGELSEYSTLEEYLYGDRSELGMVLGEATASAELATTLEASPSANLFETVVATDSAGVEWVELKKIGGETKEQVALPFSGIPQGEAYISSGLLRMFGLNKDEMIGQKFSVSYIIPDGLIPGESGRLQSQETEYKIMGVVDDETANYYYFHIGDALKLGVKNFSQIKVITKTQELVPKVRKVVGAMGFRTVSTLDTVTQIESLFGTLRLLLGFLGLIALAVASLGMFNTMTVSLLERTREVGVMKAMGMQIAEVRDLFLAESMIMGVGGGLLGVILGYLSGEIVSIVLSSVSLVKGQGMIDISFVPWFFVTFIMGVSFMVGILTGWYPSKRATKISALNALRYE